MVDVPAAAFPVRVRMYRQGLGDCFLLSFGRGTAACHILIDCGSLGSITTGVTMRDVVDDIRYTTGGHLDLLIATHEHKDHLSGFLTEQASFDHIVVDNVWVAWTEKPGDELAEKLARYRRDLTSAVGLAAAGLLAGDFGVGFRRQQATIAGAAIRDLLGFVDGGDDQAMAATVRAAMTYVQRKTGREPDYRVPGEAPLEPSWLPGVRIYVLGPPRDAKALASLGGHGSDELYELTRERARNLAATATLAFADDGLENSSQLDADRRHELDRLAAFGSTQEVPLGHPSARALARWYFDEENDWRRIDSDWLTTATDLALQLDNLTNNTSLALAFELIEDGRVLLFPADAQLGNWSSWHHEAMRWTVKDARDKVPRVVTARSLLSRTVLYKVGHHGSHNGTLRSGGLEAMEDPELVALIPVDRAVARRKTPPWQMPAPQLYRRLLERTGGRVVRSDLGWASADDVDFRTLFLPAEWKRWAAAQRRAEAAGRVRIEPLFVDWTLDA